MGKGSCAQLEMFLLCLVVFVHWLLQQSAVGVFYLIVYYPRGGISELFTFPCFVQMSHPLRWGDWGEEAKLYLMGLVLQSHCEKKPALKAGSLKTERSIAVCFEL